MTRHARNCTAGAVYTYHEKKKDAAASGYGTHSQRVGKDAIKGFDCCNLTLQPCRNPVVTKDGYLFDKEAILQYIITKKNEYSRQLKEYERQKRKEEDERTELEMAAKSSQLQKFFEGEKSIVSASTSSSNGTSSKGESVSNMSGGKAKELPSFWVPSQLPDAKVAKLKKPESKVLCPITGKPLKMKDLVEIKFTMVNDPDDKKSLIAKENRYMCPVTHDILSNSTACVVLKTTGDVITNECYEKIVKKDWKHPLTGETLTEADVIMLNRGGTGFASTNDKLESRSSRPVLQA